MTTSGTYIFTVNRDTIIRQALLDCGKLDGIETPEPQDIQDCATKLNMMVKQWQGKSDYAPGLKTWTRRRGHLFLSSTTGQYLVGPAAPGWTLAYVSPTLSTTVAAGGVAIGLSSLVGVAVLNSIGVIQTDGSLFWTTVLSVVGAVVTLTAGLPVGAAAGATVFCYVTSAQNPLYIETAILRDQYNSDTPMRIMRDVRTYDMISNKADPNNASDPGGIYYEFQLDNSNLFIDCGAAQDVNKHLVLTFLETIQDFNNPLDAPEYPQEWMLPLCLGLQKLISPMYNKPWTQLMQDNFVAALAIARHKDAEIVEMYFQPGSED